MMASQTRFLSSAIKCSCVSQIRAASIPKFNLHPTLFIRQSNTSPLRQTNNLRLRWNSTKNTNTTNTTQQPQQQQTFLQKFLAPKPMPPRNTPAWYREMILICTVFGITGTSTMFLVRPAVSNVLGLQGSLKEGPWSYRICSLVIMTPMYAVMLVVVGTCFGRHAYFRHFSVGMFKRFGIPPELMDREFERNAKNFKKW